MVVFKTKFKTSWQNPLAPPILPQQFRSAHCKKIKRPLDLIDDDVRPDDPLAVELWVYGHGRRLRRCETQIQWLVANSIGGYSC